MIRILPSFAAALVACTPSQDSAMHDPVEDPRTTNGPGKVAPDVSGGTVNPAKRVAEQQERAALGPVPEPASAAENLAPTLPADSAREAEGRRTLSTAFVRVGPDGLLTVELRNGRVLILGNVVMRRKDYCGVQVPDGRAGAQYCGEYSEVAAAHPGGAPAPKEPDLAVPNQLESPNRPVKGN